MSIRKYVSLGKLSLYDEKIKTLKSNDPILAPDDSFVIQPNTKAIFVKGKKVNKEEK